MILKSDSEGDLEAADKYLFKTVKLPEGTCAKLVGIYRNVFDTTCGIAKEIEVEVPQDSDCRYAKEYVQFIPVKYRYMNWRFPDGKIGTLTLGFSGQSYAEEPLLDSDGRHWDWVEEVCSR